MDRLTCAVQGDTLHPVEREAKKLNRRELAKAALAGSVAMLGPDLKNVEIPIPQFRTSTKTRSPGSRKAKAG